jgi:hypothetical protein
MNPLTFSKAYWSMAVPRIIYGLHMLDLSDKSLNELDSAQMVTAKRISGLATNTANIVPLAGLKWQRLSTHILRDSLFFMWQLMLLPMSSIYKKILVYRWIDIVDNNHIANTTGPVSNFINGCIQLNIYNDVERAIDTGQIMSKNAWKLIVKVKLKQKEENEWKGSSMMYDMECFKHVCSNVNDGWKWWVIARWDCKVLYKIKLTWKMFVRKYEYLPNNRKCICQTEINIVHILFECSMTDNEREMKWDSVINVMPECMKRDIEGMDAKEKVCFLYNCFNCDPIIEWMCIYHQVIEFLCDMIHKWEENVCMMQQIDM